jgi:hypothetical protein
MICIFPLFVHLLALVLLVCCWAVGDMEVRTKLILTLVYVASWGLVFVGSYAVVGAQAVLSIILGLMTFGPGFFGGRRR